MPIPTEVFGERIDPQRVVDQAAVVAQSMYTTAFEAESVVSILSVPMPVKGKRILDVAGGCSNTTAHLAGLGADAHAVDPGYADLDAMLGKFRAFTALSERASMAALHLGSNPEIDALYDAAFRQPVRLFEADITEHPERYHSESCLELPFEDNFFDEVLCHSFLTAEGGIGREFVFASMKEMLRVLRQGGSVRLGPWLPPNGLPESKRVGQKTIEANLVAVAEAAKRSKVITKMRRLNITNGQSSSWTFLYQKR